MTLISNQAYDLLRYRFAIAYFVCLLGLVGGCAKAELDRPSPVLAPSNEASIDCRRFGGRGGTGTDSVYLLLKGYTSTWHWRTFPCGQTGSVEDLSKTVQLATPCTDAPQLMCFQDRSGPDAILIAIPRNFSGEEKKWRYSGFEFQSTRLGENVQDADMVLIRSNSLSDSAPRVQTIVYSITRGVISAIVGSSENPASDVYVLAGGLGVLAHVNH